MHVLKHAAQTCSACKLAGVQIIPLPTLANQILARTFFRSVVLLCAYLAVEKFFRASSAGGRRRLQQNFVNQIVSVAEDCLSPAGSFHGCSLKHFRGCIRRAHSTQRRTKFEVHPASILPHPLNSILKNSQSKRIVFSHCRRVKIHTRPLRMLCPPRVSLRMRH